MGIGLIYMGGSLGHRMGPLVHVIHETFHHYYSQWAVPEGNWACGIDSVLETYRQKLVTVEQKVVYV